MPFQLLSEFKENFCNWTNGNGKIDDFIKDTQKNAQESEFGELYTANWKDGPKNTWDSKEKKFLPKSHLLKVALVCIGKDPDLLLAKFLVSLEAVTGNFMIVTETQEWDLRRYMSHHFVSITLQKRITILHTIACTLESKKNRNETETVKPNVVICLKELGLVLYGKEVNNINISIPNCYFDLMQKCCNKNLNERPTILELAEQLKKWVVDGQNKKQFEKAEKKRVEQLKASGKDPNEKIKNPVKVHSQAIYSSRLIKFPKTSKTKYEEETKDNINIYVIDNSFFNKKTTPAEVSKDIVIVENDEDTKKQVEVSIPEDRYETNKLKVYLNEIIKFSN
ncbi:23667_t:CDS:2 [Gigaspora margarita]|uniref:23667_t:CDS:1 n=1 Tax=Gigaspora margarita TaxID=4874 RepID=A0ABN7V9B9_GIGMA|nr:23667_t:CDS:2 [Gigaspora margarita]